MRSFTCHLCLVLCAFAVPALASAQTRELPPAGPIANVAPAASGAAPAAGSVAAHAAPAQDVPFIDGSVLDDKAWATAKVITGFWQTTPDEGQPASENTEVRVLYSETALYIGVVNYDRSPELIISSESRRDASLTNTDSFLVILDTFRDRQNGFVFGTSPAGIEYDGQVIGEGQGGAAVVAAAEEVAAAAVVVVVAGAVAVHKPADQAAGSTSTGMVPGRSNRRRLPAAGARSLPFRSARCAIPRATCRNGASTFSGTFAGGTRLRTGRRFRGNTI